MDDTVKIAVGVLIPFLGTMLGAGMIFLLREEINPLLQKIFLAFASGVMLAASVWSLITPSIEMAEEQGMIPWIPAAAGFLLGIGFLLLLDNIIPHLHRYEDKTEGLKAPFGRSAMLFLAMTLHNIPEGMAVGVTFAGALAGNAGISLAAASALAIGMAVQNFPEGMVITMPLAGSGMGKRKAFLYGTLSGIVEPVGAVLTIALANLVVPVLPYILSFAAGAMIYVVVEELIPEAQAGEHSNIATIAVAIGFVLMMILDVALG